MLLVRPPNRGVGRIEGELILAIVPAPPRINRVRVVHSPIYHTFDGRKLIIPEGLEFDGASMPVAVRPDLGDCLSSCNALPGAYHDGFYRLGVAIELRGVDVAEVAITKADADMLLWDLCLCVGHSEFDAAAIFEGVNLGGHEAWSENERKRSVAGRDRAKLLAWA